jgi:hypothetical protein
MVGNSEENDYYAGWFSVSSAAYVPTLSMELFCVEFSTTR